MKTKTIRFAIILIIFTSVFQSYATATTRADEKKAKDKTTGKAVKLFNGKDLSNWVFKLKDPSVDPAKVFTVSNGVIHISGSPFGYMRTKESYSDYKLNVEWRWPSEATNSGLFIHAQEPDSIWLRCIECQLKAGNAGDFVCMNGSDMKEKTDKSKIVVNKYAASSEKPAGEWNTMEVVCRGNEITVYVNGTLQNKGTGLNITKGSICLQSEGKEIEFRNVFLKKLK
jgi:hypothetical protein